MTGCSQALGSPQSSVGGHGWGQTLNVENGRLGRSRTGRGGGPIKFPISPFVTAPQSRLAPAWWHWTGGMLDGWVPWPRLGVAM